MVWRLARASSSSRASGVRCAASTRLPPAGLRIPGRGGSLVEAAGVGLHPGRFLADAVEAKSLDEPDGAAGVVAGDMLAPDQGDDVPEAALVLGDQAATVGVLLLHHLVEHGGSRREVLAEAVGVGRVDACVVLLRGDRESQHLLLRQSRERFPVAKKAEHEACPRFACVAHRRERHDVPPGYPADRPSRRGRSLPAAGAPVAALAPPALRRQLAGRIGRSGGGHLPCRSGGNRPEACPGVPSASRARARHHRRRGWQLPTRAEVRPGMRSYGTC